jgi:O-antigen ligase
MELAIALPLGLLFSGAVENYKRPIYAFAATLMGVALIVTNSRGGIVSLVAEILFLVVIAGPGATSSEPGSKRRLVRAVLLRGAMALGLAIALCLGALALGGPDVFSRLLGTASFEDPTTGRGHFWRVTLEVIKHHPVIGSGLGSLGVIYTRYDSGHGLYRLEQAHNDYLQILSDAGIVGGLLGAAFVVILFRVGFARRNTEDKFRRGVATGALAGCFAVLVHSAFDFTLHTTANALLFLVLAAMATQDRRVDESSGGVRKRRRRRSHSRHELEASIPAPTALEDRKPAALPAQT